MGTIAKDNLLVKEGGPFVVSHKWIDDSLSCEDRLLENNFLKRKKDSDETARVPTSMPPSSPIALFRAAQFDIDSMDM